MPARILSARRTLNAGMRVSESVQRQTVIASDRFDAMRSALWIARTLVGCRVEVVPVKEGAFQPSGKDLAGRAAQHTRDGVCESC